MARQEPFNVVLTGGGSGGHIYPLLAVADVLQKKVADLGAQTQFFYLGPRDAYAPFFTNHGIRIRPISAGKVRRYFSLENILVPPGRRVLHTRYNRGPLLRVTPHPLAEIWPPCVRRRSGGVRGPPRRRGTLLRPVLRKASASVSASASESA